MNEQNYSITLEQDGLIKFEGSFDGNTKRDCWPNAVKLTKDVTDSANIIIHGDRQYCIFNGESLSWNHPAIIDELGDYSSSKVVARNAVDNVVNRLNDELQMVFSPHTVGNHISTQVFYQSTNQILPPDKTNSLMNWRKKSQTWLSNYLSENENNFQFDEKLVSDLSPTDSFSRIVQILSKMSRPGAISLSMQKSSDQKGKTLKMHFSNDYIQPRFILERNDTAAHLIYEISDQVSQYNSTLASYLLFVAMIHQLTLSDLTENITFEAYVGESGTNFVLTNLKVALNIGSDGWVDGLYYASNLPANLLINSEIEGVKFSCD